MHVALRLSKFYWTSKQLQCLVEFMTMRAAAPGAKSAIYNWLVVLGSWSWSFKNVSTPLKVSILVLSGPPSDTSSLGRHEPASKWYFHRFSRFCRVHPCYRHTDAHKQTTHVLLHGTYRVNGTECTGTNHCSKPQFRVTNDSQRRHVWFHISHRNLQRTQQFHFYFILFIN